MILGFLPTDSFLQIKFWIEEEEEEALTLTLNQMFLQGVETEVDSLVGIRFHPRDEEIIFLLKMKRRDPRFSVRTIKEIDFYSFEPWELPCK